MKNYVQPGDTIVATAPAAVSSGAGILIGALFGIATQDAANGADLPIKTLGVFTLPKAASQAWTAGDKVYWDDANDECTIVASGNYPIGIATADVAGGAADMTGTVRLDGIATAAAA